MDETTSRNDAKARIESPLLTVPEAAAYLRISASTLYHWISERRVVPVKYRNGAVRFDIRDLERFIKSSKLRTKRNGGSRPNNEPQEA